MTYPSDITLFCVRHHGTLPTAEQREQGMRVLATGDESIGIDITRARRCILAPRKPRMPSVPPDGLLTAAEAARKLRISIKTLLAHVAAGEIGYVSIGHGRKRPRRMFTHADLDQFIANQTRKDVPCPSTRTRTAARRISTSTSKCEVIGFMARRNARRGVKPKK